MRSDYYNRRSKIMERQTKATERRNELYAERTSLMKVTMERRQRIGMMNAASSILKVFLPLIGILMLFVFMVTPERTLFFTNILEYISNFNFDSDMLIDCLRNFSDINAWTVNLNIPSWLNWLVDGFVSIGQFLAVCGNIALLIQILLLYACNFLVFIFGFIFNSAV